MTTASPAPPAAQERVLPQFRFVFDDAELLADETTDFQRIRFYRTPSHGVLMMIDGAVMTTERDEFVYHETLAHLPLFTHPDPRRVLILGGGDLGIARECLKHAGVGRIDVCEIDGRVVDLSREHLPWTEAVFADPRVHVHIGDGFDWLDDPGRRGAFDVACLDLTDGAGDHGQDQSARLFTADFFRKLKAALAEGAVVAGQCESAFYHQDFIAGTAAELRRVFGRAEFCTAAVPTYMGGPWCFYLAGDGDLSLSQHRRAAARVMGQTLQWYDDRQHAAAFAVPAALRRKIVAAS